jgi:hypothetical protein
MYMNRKIASSSSFIAPLNFIVAGYKLQRNIENMKLECGNISRCGKGNKTHFLKEIGLFVGR